MAIPALNPFARRPAASAPERLRGAAVFALAMLLHLLLLLGFPGGQGMVSGTGQERVLELHLGVDGEAANLPSAFRGLGASILGQEGPPRPRYLPARAESRPSRETDLPWGPAALPQPAGTPLVRGPALIGSEDLNLRQPQPLGLPDRQTTTGQSQGEGEEDRPLAFSAPAYQESLVPPVLRETALTAALARRFQRGTTLPPGLQLQGYPAYPDSCRLGICRNGIPCIGSGLWRVTVHRAGERPAKLELLESAGCGLLDASMRKYLSELRPGQAGVFELRFNLPRGTGPQP